MPDVKYKCTRLTAITFQNEVDVILQSVLLLITYHSLTNQEGGTIMINHFRPHPIGVNKPMLLMQQQMLEIPMSHQKLLQTIGVEQPRPHVCYISN